MARRGATYVPSVTPARGVVVTVDGLPGTWQISDKSPTRGNWWLVAMDDEAKAHKSFAEASAKEMSRPTKITVEN
ncbi:hypothetical protein SEA_MUFASA8_54 [Arthrobacter phage Mufasa8]|uniref:Uncharacterized protein n=1 Tax=Arthrobacter phage Mufasa8 TaxID=2656526 RepID=A0A649VNI6_9CAUD|nr:hypothetical protein HYQ08_gp054 [Arthrobacter phage Mufasa8]QGJ93502.1 hypothetical protein SEA_MUFASA8_54 [Arthrobacter phage Mufasa8]